MVTIRIVSGTGTGPTEMAAFDAALIDADLTGYNLIPVSSMIPADATIEVDPLEVDLGPIGSCLTVVCAKALATGETPVSAGVTWGRRPDGAGVFYEESATGPNAQAAVSSALEEGLEYAYAMRNWSMVECDTHLISQPASGEAYTCAVVVAVYGSGYRPWNESTRPE